MPDDVSVIGFDDELYKTIPNSILTSVKFRHRELRASVRLTRSSQVWKPRAQKPYARLGRAGRAFQA